MKKIKSLLTSFLTLMLIIVCVNTISFAQAALGGDIRIKTIDGDVLFNIKPGTQTDTKIRLKGKGVPTLRNKQVRGDHYVTLVVKVPEKLNSEQKEALKAFDAAMGGTLNEGNNAPKEGKSGKKKSFVDKVKDAFD